MRLRPRKAATRTRRCRRAARASAARVTCRCAVAASCACTASVGARASAIMFMTDGSPVSGSRDAGRPFLPMNGQHAEVLVRRVLRVRDGARSPIHGHVRLPATRGRGPGCVLQPVGSRTTSSVNSGSSGLPSASRGGHGRRRGSARAPAAANARPGPPAGRCGQFEPSIAANSGSLPCVASQRSRAVAADRLIASAGWWQVMQARPLVPSGSKKGWPQVSSCPRSSSTRLVPSALA